MVLHMGCTSTLIGDRLTCAELCDPNAECLEEGSRVTCTCSAGFDGDGTICVDIDECRAANPCGNGACANQPGGYSCACEPGYEYDGATCQLELFTIIGDGAATPHTWSDGSLAASCKDYRFPEPPYLYQGQTGDGLYTVDSSAGVVSVYCDMTTDGGGWTRIIDWNRIDDPEHHTLASLLAGFVDEVAMAANPNVSPMGDLTEFEIGIRWSDLGFTYDALSYRRDIAIANDGELRLDIHYDGQSMEGSGVWLYVIAEDARKDILCWSDADDNTSYTLDERALIPYACGTDNNIDTFTWKSVETRDLGGKITAFYLRSLHADDNLGDSSLLYRLSLLVR